MLKGQGFFFMDLATVDEIFNYYVGNHQWEKARKLLRFALKSHPSSSELYFKQSRLNFELGHFHASLAQLERALQYSPMNTEYLLFKADILTQMEAYTDALQVLDQLRSIHLNPAEVLLQMGNVAQISGKYQDSEFFYRQALEEAPDYEEALYELVFFLESRGRQGEGVRLYLDFLDQNPYSANIWYNLGLLYRSVDNFEKAIEAFDFAIVIQEDLISAHFNKGLLLIELERYREGLQTFLEANAIEKDDPHVHYHIGECYENLGMIRDAVRYYKSATQSDEGFTDAWMGLGFCMEQWEKYLEAIHFYKKAYKADQENAEICLSLAICEYKLGNRVGAVQYLEEAIAVNPQDETIWQDWAQLLHEQGNTAGAISSLEEGIRNNQDKYGLYYQCAAYCLTTGEERLGLTFLENALLMDYANHDILFQYIPTLRSHALVLSLIQRYKL